jgi:hypothetical protein
MLNITDLKAALNDLGRPLLTLYLHVDNARRENQAETPAWRIELKNALQSASQSLVHQSDADALDAIRVQVDRFFADYTPTAKTLVLYADGDQLYTYNLPVALQSQSHFGQALITPLLWALDEYERYLIVQVDRERAYLTSAYLGSVTPHADMQIELDDYDFRQRTLMPSGFKGQGSGSGTPGGTDRDSYDHLIDAHRKRFYKQVVEQLQALSAEMGRPRMILSGDEKAAHELHDELPDPLKGHLAGLAPAPMDAPSANLLEAVMPVALDYERERETEMVREVVNLAKAGGRGAVGHANVVQALVEQRVELLLLPYPPTDSDIANDLKLQAFTHGAQIELVHGGAADLLAAAGGVAARLYYTYPATDLTS